MQCLFSLPFHPPDNGSVLKVVFAEDSHDGHSPVIAEEIVVSWHWHYISSAMSLMQGTYTYFTDQIMVEGCFLKYPLYTKKLFCY